MCGITGIYNYRSDQAIVIDQMLKKLSHRGPDESHYWQDDKLILGHTRLSILGLGHAGAQPMHSASDRYVITYNGEIYNFPTLKNQLAEQGYVFTTGTDTEVILAGFEQFGCLQTLHMLDGMFAFAVWDKKEKVLYLARDRFGEKPLYYAWCGDSFVFASELKALLLHPDCKKEIDDSSIPTYLDYGYIPAPKTIYRHIYKLPPAHVLRITPGKRESVEAYWSATAVANTARKKPLLLSDQEAIAQLELVLKESVASRMIADVPVGAFFSGGIDSSAIVTLMSQLQPNLKTYTIGLAESTHDESQYAKRLAAHLNVDYSEIMVTANDAFAVIPKITGIYDEPFADSSQIPTFLVSEFASRQLRVVLTGDGGDELFGGYNRHIHAEKLRTRLNLLPQPVRKLIRRTLNSCKPQVWQAFYRLLSFSGRNRLPYFTDKLQTLSNLLMAPTTEMTQFYHSICSAYVDTAALLRPERFASLAGGMGNVDSYPPLADYDFSQWMMLADTLTYLPGDILTKVDRAAMANSLETRAPFLSPSVFEFAWQLPLRQKIQNQQGKWLLLQWLKQKLPSDLIERPKMGFGLPLADWLRTGLRDWAESLLGETSLAKTAIFSPPAVRKLWQTHLSGHGNYAKILWHILMLQSWYENHG